MHPRTHAIALRVHNTNTQHRRCTVNEHPKHARRKRAASITRTGRKHATHTVNTDIALNAHSTQARHASITRKCTRVADECAGAKRRDRRRRRVRRHKVPRKQAPNADITRTGRKHNTQVYKSRRRVRRRKAPRQETRASA